MLGNLVFRDLVVGAGHAGWLGRDVLSRQPWLLHGPRRELWLLTRR